MALPPDQVLLDELANVKIRDTSRNVYRLDHDEGQHDDRASLALCVQHLLDKPPIDHRAYSSISIDRTEPAVVAGTWRDMPRLS